MSRQIIVSVDEEKRLVLMRPQDEAEPRFLLLMLPDEARTIADLLIKGAGILEPSGLTGLTITEVNDSWIQETGDQNLKRITP